MRVSSSRPRRALPVRRAMLLAGASLVSLLAATSAQAGDILRGPSLSAPITAAAASQAAEQQAALAAQRAQETLSRTTQALQAMQAAQASAHAMALSTASSLNVPDGLGAGGLQVVANPVPAAQDQTGLATWQGATAPTQTTDASGNVNVTVNQTASRAVLSWQSFNVGSKTTVDFNQQGNPDWIALNRVVGSTSPSQILGNIKADGTVLILNQNGIIFGGSSQINVNSLIASTLDIGRDIDHASGVVRTVVQKNQEFLTYGLLGYADANPISGTSINPAQILSVDATQTGATSYQYYASGAVTVQNGAQITSADGGYILLAGPTVENAGQLSASDGQVILAAGDSVQVVRATGAADSLDPNVRGFLVEVANLQAANLQTAGPEAVVLDATSLISSPRGSILISGADAVVQQGALFSSTSVSRNGAIEISAPDIEIAPNSMIAITPDDDGSTIPQDPTSLSDFKPSVVTIGNLNDRFNSISVHAALIDIGADALIYAPSGNITIGAAPGASTLDGTSAASRVFIDTGATIDASGLKDVLIPASRNQIEISPLKANELADDPQYKNSFLNGATVYVDPRLSGVRSDGVAWVGSPLVDAASYAQQVGVSASELMTKGGNVSLGVDSYAGGTAATNAPDVIVKAGATIDVSGGWVTYQAGKVQTTQLLTSDGRIVNIGNANLTDTYVGIYNGYTVEHSRWGVTQAYAQPLGGGSYYEPSYTEGRDAGSLTIKASATEIDGTVYAQAFPGERQIQDGQASTATSGIYGDSRTLQAAPSQLPSGGLLFIQSEEDGTPFGGGADIVIQPGANYQALPGSLAYGQVLQAGANGQVTVPGRDPSSFLTAAQLGTTELSDSLLSDSGFSAVALATSGAVTIEAGANVSLAAGGSFDVIAGRAITVDGTVSVPSGSISLATYTIGTSGSVFSPSTAQVGNYDVIVNGTLSVAGRWVNDFGIDTAGMQGDAWINGGSITLFAAPRISTEFDVQPGQPSSTSTDLSGSILINPGSLVDVSGGGYVDQRGNLNLTAKGGSLSLYDEASYFQIAGSNQDDVAGFLSGFRVNGLIASSGSSLFPYVPVNPAQMNARVEIDPDSIRAQGFAGGGTFTLATPEFAFGSDTAGGATELPLDFFQNAGFANYNITSYKTDIIANPFNNGLGGTDAILATQVLTIGAGQNLNLTQSILPNVLNSTQTLALQHLGTGGDLFSVLTPAVPGDAWDRKAANLTLGGLIELDIAAGGSITGDAGAQLTVSKLLNQGTINLPGGTLAQRLVMPVLYTQSGTLGVHALGDIFSINADGTISENAPSLIPGLTNAQLAGSGTSNGTPHPIYLLGNLDAGQGIVLAPGSVTDLSGVSIRDPYATVGSNNSLIATGRIVDGGTLSAAPSAALNGQSLFQAKGSDVYQGLAGGTAPNNGNGITNSALGVTQVGSTITADAGATLNLSGASDTFDVPVAGKGSSVGADGYVATPVWSNAGALSAGAGATLTGATILAHGGAPQAEGGTLTLLDPVLTRQDPATPTANVISADQIGAAGFTTLVALGSVSSNGDVTLNLGRGFFLEDRPVIDDGRFLDPNTLVPTIRSGGGTLTINAPYISFDSSFDTISSPAQGTAGSGRAVFNAGEIDFTGTLLVDQSVSDAAFNATGDIRLTGVAPWQQTYYPDVTPVQTLNGQIAASGNLTLTAGQIYPTTGSTFAITSAGANGTVTFARSGATTPAAPYSAGGNLLVQAANIVQGGVIRVPLGTLTLGGSAATAFAPATQSVELTDNSLTSVSANGLVIPYGTTTDQTEWYFAPASSNPLTAPPEKLLSLNGANIAIDHGANVDISGGGDVYAYEFVPGTGGSRDVLNQLNPDTFTSNNGYQYPDGRQVYAIVPGLSNAPVAAYDPIYSANYGALSAPSGQGLRVWLNGGNGLAAGWYTLLPAQYALLPGGMRVVEETGASNVAVGTSTTAPDGSLMVSGYYGDAISGSAQSQVRLFEVQSQAVIAKESDDVQTTGNTYFAKLATQNGTGAPQLPIDAGRLVLNPSATLTVSATLSTAAADGGRGAQIDISAAAIDILSSLPATVPNDGTVRVTATSLTNLDADSLLIGGTRTDNADGSTTLDVMAGAIAVSNDGSTPLSAGEVLLAANNSITVSAGSVISATGTLSDTRTGAYEIGSSTTSGSGALLRVANGPERLVSRTNVGAPASLTVAAATLSGNALMFDSSGTNSLDPNLVIQNAKYVAIGAPRIGFGADPASYDGLAITGELESLLTQSGARLTLRSQSSIDFMGGDYNFGDIRFDAAALSDLNGGAVTIHGGAVSLGNSGATGVVCTSCTAGNGTLEIDANSIVFTGGDVATKASVLAANTQMNFAQDTSLVLPVGTLVGGHPLTQPATIIVPASTLLTAGKGTALILPAGGAAGLNAGTQITLGNVTLTLPAGATYNFPNGAVVLGASGLPNPDPAGNYLVGSTATVSLATAQAVVASATPIATTQFFGNLTLSAPGGVYSQGVGSVLDAGIAPVTLHTPYIGDRVTPGTAAGSTAIPDLTLTSSGAIAIDNIGAATIGAITGIAGGAITIDGQSVSVSGTDIRGTAGKVAINSTTGITLSNGATIEAPGYVATFGDSVDPTTQNAPGGSVTLSAQNGDTDLGNATVSVGGGNGNAGTLTLSAPAGTVDFGTATLNGQPGTGGTGASFVLVSAGTVDLAALNTKLGADGFTGGFSVDTSAGDLILAAGETLNAGSVSLTADGGLVDIAGSINTSGISGGDVSLYGRNGVTLEGTAKIDASASGYASSDTRQAKGGDVTLGTDFTASTTNANGSISGTSGAISIARGAVIDVSAHNPGDRLVPYYANNVEYYDYVQGDQGGTLTLRAPVITQSGNNTVNVAVADGSSVVGASAVDLVGFKRWDLGAVAGSGLYSGVTLSGNTVTLNVATGLDTANANGTLTTVSGINFLGDNGTANAPTLVDFVRNYSVSAAYANLGGLASQSNFHSQPGMDLGYAGNIVLASNWNLGAGIVNQNAAIAGGAMKMDPALNRPVVIAGQEANVLANYTTMFYRTGGSIYGEPGVLTLRAGGSLDLKGSITDGFFQFQDQTDPTYLSELGVVNGASAFVFNAGWTTCSTPTAAGCKTPGLAVWGASTFGTAGTTGPTAYFGIGLVPATGAALTSPNSAPVVQNAPFSAIANSPAALGSFPQGSGADTSSVPNGGDPLGSAVVFPLLPQPDGSTRAVSSWSYNLVAGAAATPGGGASSVNPLTIGAIAANLLVQGTASYTYAKNAPASVQENGVFFDTSPQYTAATKPIAGTGFVSASDWLSQFSSLYSGLISDNTVASVFWGNGSSNPLYKLMFAGASGATNLQTPAPDSLLGQFIANNHLVQGSGGSNSSNEVIGNYRLSTLTTATPKNGVYMTVGLLKEFVQQEIIPNMAAIQAAFPPTGSSGAPGPTVTAYTKTMVRTGTGSIDMAAAGNVDLSNGSNAENIQQVYQRGTANVTTVAGGTSVYTAGHPVAPATVQLTAPDSGSTITVALGAAMSSTNNLTGEGSYAYGTGTAGSSAPGILVANPVYLEDGGNISVSAGGDVLGRRDGYVATDIVELSSAPSWVGAVDQPWRIGSVGANTSAAINPQLFTDGIATLGGGNIAVSAGHNVSDLSVIATDSLVTASAIGNVLPTQALAAFGGGNVMISAGNDLLGGRVDVASGTGRIDAGQDILSAGTFNAITVDSKIGSPIDNLLRIRLSDATVDIGAGGTVSLQGVAALGVQQSNNGAQSGQGVTINNYDARGLYSNIAGLTIVGDGSVNVANQNDNLTSNNYSVYPGTFMAASLSGNLDIGTLTTDPNAATAVLLYPSTVGQLQLLAAGNIAPATIAMLDSDPGQLPGVFSSFAETGSFVVTSGLNWAFPAVTPSTTQAQLELQHRAAALHAGDPNPIRIDAGADIGSDQAGLILSVPKQARVYAGQDIINMMFFGQNLNSSDITRIAAGRDITATSKLAVPLTGVGAGGTQLFGTPEAALLGNTFVIGGPGSFILQAGRNLGPFLNSASVTSLSGTSVPFNPTDETYGGGVLSVGNEWNPWLPTQSASISVLFGVADGINYDGFREAYLDPANLASMPGYLFAQETVTTTAGGVTTQTTTADRSQPIYGPVLVAWMQQNDGAGLIAAYGTTNVSYQQAYQVFAGLPALRQEAFLDQVYFDELKQTADPASPSYLQYGRGYAAVNTLFPASYGYTQNDLTGGTNGANQTVSTGNLDLRLATIQTEWGGDITILGPGGRVLAGSTVRTDQQAARRTFLGQALFEGGLAANVFPRGADLPVDITAIPSGYEGVITLRGGSISTFTDGDFLLNQSRLFTEDGGDIIMWSSNADLNAGQGPKTSANFPPVVLRVDDNLYSEADQSGATTGAGIAALQASPDAPTASVYLIAPRGTVDAGAAGVRVSGDLFVAALSVANADNFQVGGHAFGIPTAPVVDTGGMLAASNNAAANAQAAMAPSAQPANTDLPSIITVEVLGYGGDDDDRNRRRDGGGQ